MNKNDQDKIDDCIARIRMARNIGLSKEDIFAHFSTSTAHVYTNEELFLAWHAACILDPESKE